MTSALPWLFSSMLVVGAGHAETIDRAASGAAFEQALKAKKDGDMATACRHFRESYRLDDASYGALANVADCDERDGKTATAWQEYQRAYDMARPRKTEEELKSLKDRLDAIQPRVPRLLVRLDAKGLSGVKVKRGDIELDAASLGTEVPVDPGSFELTVLAPGRAPRAYPLTLREGERRELPVEPGEPTAPAPPASTLLATTSSAPAAPPATTVSSGAPVLAYALVGVGAASLIVGGITGFLARDRSDTVKDRCGPSYQCDQQGYDAAQSGKTLALTSTVTTIVGVAGLGVGGYLLWSHRSSTATASVRVRGGPGMAGLVMGGSF